MKLSSFEGQRPAGYVADEEVVSTKRSKKMVSPAPVKMNTADAKTEMSKMTPQQCIEYANQGSVHLMRSRIVQLNESIEAVRAEGNTVHEWEALMMVIHELERVIVNIPGYIDPVRGTTD